MCLDIIIQKDTHIVVFIISVNVLFLSNSQRRSRLPSLCLGVYHKCQCPLFKQFTTPENRQNIFIMVFIISVNVLFLSNSQRVRDVFCFCCGVYHKCQCPLFKQFTTSMHSGGGCRWVFIISVNVLFLSNSQRSSSMSLSEAWCLS